MTCKWPAVFIVLIICFMLLVEVVTGPHYNKITECFQTLFANVGEKENVKVCKKEISRDGNSMCSIRCVLSYKRKSRKWLIIVCILGISNAARVDFDVWSELKLRLTSVFMSLEKSVILANIHLNLKIGFETMVKTKGKVEDEPFNWNMPLTLTDTIFIFT